ncbi:MAG: hypothetical protein DMG71_13330 [Acidobacteria bacterium]|nr:MAG: hypothetical protein DMG71_13330 [Acidobacteriota bacterium]
MAYSAGGAAPSQDCSAMTLSVIFVVIALLVVVSLWRIAYSHKNVVQNSAELTGRLRAVDLQAFQNLVKT